MSEAPILDALAEAAEAAAAVFRRHAAPARPAWSAGGPGTLPARAREISPALGPRQADVLSELEAAGSEGMTPGAIGRTLSYAPPDTHVTLGALAGKGLVTEDTSVEPHVYRLSPELLGSAAGGDQPSR